LTSPYLTLIPLTQMIKKTSENGQKLRNNMIGGIGQL